MRTYVSSIESAAQGKSPSAAGDEAKTPSTLARPLPSVSGRGASEITATDVCAWFGGRLVLDRVSLVMERSKVTSLIGPSGCGKSTFLRILNRMHEVVPGAQLAGSVALDGEDIYGPTKRATETASAHRHGLPEAEPVSGDVDLRQRLVGPQVLAYQDVRPGRTRGGDAPQGGSLERGPQPLEGARRRALRRSAAAPLHCPRPRGAPVGAADGRAVLGPRPHVNSTRSRRRSRRLQRT